MGHEMVQRIHRNKDNWLRLIINLNPVKKYGFVANAIEITSNRQKAELKEIREKILLYEKNGCIAEKLTDTI